MTRRFRDAVLAEPSRMPQEWFDYERLAGGNYEDGTTWGSQYDKHSMAVCVEAAADTIEAKDWQDDDDRETIIRLRRCAGQYMEITSSPMLFAIATGCYQKNADRDMGRWVCVQRGFLFVENSRRVPDVAWGATKK